MDKNFKGLTTAQAVASAKQHGSNAFTQKNKIGFFKRYLASFGDPIIRILLIALGVNLILMFRDANWYESVGIAIAVLLATLISTLSEMGSESAFEKLSEEAATIKCRVLRDGKLTELPITDIVIGDIVCISAGERIPADGYLVDGEVDIDQSALNGETKEARKRAAIESSHADLLSPSGVFRGGIVSAGEGQMLVTKVGDGTLYGGLASDMQETAIDSPLKTRLTELANVISRFGYAAAAIVVVANLVNSIFITGNVYDGRSLFSAIMMAVTLGITVIVMAVPEGLPMMITVVLSANMRRMLKDNVLVRKLIGIETAGSLNILFTDKTGTLTKGLLEVTKVITPEGKVLDAKEYKGFPLYSRLAINAFYNNGAKLVSQKLQTRAIGGNSTDRSLLEYIKKEAPGLPLCQKGFVKLFDSKDKYSVAEVFGEAKGILLKGAPEVLLPACKNTQNLNEIITRQAQEGYRLLALCEAECKTDAQNLRNLTLIAIVCIRDELRPEAKQAVEEVTDAGIQVVMVTGDNKDTAVNIAAKLGSPRTGIITSRALNQLSDEEVKKLLPKLRVVARALPSDKGRLVRLAQEMGLVAGMTGDGVNDAPALKRADVGFAMGDGTEIAKEAGDIVILDNNFASISKAVLYGRTIFKSIRKFLIFQLTINFCAVGISVIGPFIGVPIPVTVIQMLWINMIMDTLAGLAYAGETPLPEYMKEPPKKRNEPIINRYMLNQITTTGLYTILLGLAFFVLPFFFTAFRSNHGYFFTAFFALFVFSGVFNSLNARTHRLNLFAYITRNKMFICIMVLVSVMQILLIYFGGAVFRTTGLNSRELGLVLMLASTVIVFDLARKVVLRLNNRKGFV